MVMFWPYFGNGRKRWENVLSPNKDTVVQQPNGHFEDNLEKNVDSDIGSHLESKSAWCPCGIIGHFPKSKMASTMAAKKGEIS